MDRVVLCLFLDSDVDIYKASGWAIVALVTATITLYSTVLSVRHSRGLSLAVW